MTTFVNVRERVLQEVNKLPDEKLSYLLQFIQKIQDYSESNNDPIIDPLADFIGGVEHGRLAQNIEQDLYE